MRLILTAFLMLALYACSDTSNSSESASIDDRATYCLFSTEGLNDCHGTIDGRPFSVTLEMGEEKYDEKSILAIIVDIGGISQKLLLSDDVTIIEGDRGYIKLKDINFDGFRDIAITTSFGVANLHLDYWVYDPADRRFQYVGNFPDLTPIPEDETLTSNVRLNAESYSHSTWLWIDGKLVEKE